MLRSLDIIKHPLSTFLMYMQIQCDSFTQILKCRLVYRSKQRGFLELDLVLGNWVEENIRSMDELRIKALIDVLDLVL